MPRPKFSGGSIVLYEELNTFESLIAKLPDGCLSQQLYSQTMSAKRALMTDDRTYVRRIIDIIRDALIDAFDVARVE